MFTQSYMKYLPMFSHFCNLRAFPDCGRCAQGILFRCPHSTFIVRVWVRAYALTPVYNKRG